MLLVHSTTLSFLHIVICRFGTASEFVEILILLDVCNFGMGSNSLNKVRIGSLAWIKKFEIYKNGSVEVAWSLKSSAIAKLLKTWNNMFVEERRLEFYFQILPSNFSSLLWVDFGLLMNLFVQM